MALDRYTAAIGTFYGTPFQLRRKVAELISGQTKDGVDTRAGGSITFNGTGAQTAFVIPHTLGVAPARLHVTSTTAAAAGSRYVTSDANNITVTFTAAPASGTNNVGFLWDAAASI